MNQQTLVLEVERAVVDGFCLDLTTLFVPGRFVPAALGQLEALRKSGLYRARWYGVPEEPTFIAAYDTFEEQVRIAPGSYLWGIIAAQMPSIYLIRIVEGSTGIPLMSDWVAGGNLVTRPPYPLNSAVILLSQPRLIVDPGYVNVEISNTEPSDSTHFSEPQLVLLCAEPCVVIEENLERPRYV